MTSTNDKITALRETLAELVGEWECDESHPPNYVRKTGLGIVVAKVDVWCGGYQDVHKPIMIGWKAAERDQDGAGHHERSGVVMTAEYEHDNPIVVAKALADKALGELEKELS